MTTVFNWSHFKALPVIGILRGYSTAQVEKIIHHSCRGGLRNIEITMNSDHAVELIALAKERAEGRMNVGAGTVCTLADLDAALTAGATFIVTPIIDADVIKACNQEGVPVIPGGFTPTEVYRAWELGADMVKLFPANQFGPGYLKDLLGPFDKIKLVPTGGVNLANFSQYLQSGAYGFGVASPLFDMKRVEAEQWNWLEQQARSFVELYQAQ
ncbi:MAG: bifunctional 4-hydroxy-2-oxoglutarate aldolase/2-dehydro-3-deoxy-phosphogluconate aldolase [Candidatus Polarisedimenticolaceae bacterium]|nr:bifunctional 4-hydroxy-2-oxoglutarate aldolase/2-dehydro-3-deoxy-phosphogluconate aldolase [Candidatus Polarisedimenticolaceae bacterium]